MKKISEKTLLRLLIIFLPLLFSACKHELYEEQNTIDTSLELKDNYKYPSVKAIINPEDGLVIY